MKRLTLTIGGGAAVLLASGCQTPGGQQYVTDPISKRKLAVESETRIGVNAATYFAYGHLLERRGDLDGAVEQYTRALEAQPSYPQAQNRIGVCFNKLGRHAEATRAFRLAVQDTPASEQALNNLGFSLYLQNELSEAEQVLRKALTIQPDFNRARMNLGLVLAKQGRAQEAYDAFSLVGSPADAHYNVAVVQSEVGDINGAVQSLKLALSQEPRHRLARAQLRELTGSTDLAPDFVAPPAVANAPSSAAPPVAAGNYPQASAAPLPMQEMTPVTPATPPRPSAPSEGFAPPPAFAGNAPTRSDAVQPAGQPSPAAPPPQNSHTPMPPAMASRSDGSAVAETRSRPVIGIMTPVPPTRSTATVVPQARQNPQIAQQTHVAHGPIGIMHPVPPTQQQSVSATPAAQRAPEAPAANPSPALTWSPTRPGYYAARSASANEQAGGKVSAQSVEDSSPRVPDLPRLINTPSPSSSPTRELTPTQPSTGQADIATKKDPRPNSAAHATQSLTQRSPSQPPSAPDPCEIPEMMEVD